MSQKWIHPIFRRQGVSVKKLSMFCSGKRFSPCHTTELELKTNIPLQSTALQQTGSGAFSVVDIMDSSWKEIISCYRYPILVGLTIIAVSFSVLTFSLKGNFSESQVIAALSLSDFRLKVENKIDKNSFLSHLDNKKKIQLSNQAHFVADLIRSSRISLEDSRKLASMIVLESARSGYDPLLVTAVIKSESTFNRYARSHRGALGLMQIMPDTGKFVSNLKKVEWRGSGKLKDPEYNLRLGIAYLKHLEEAFDGNREHMLIAYNWGPHNTSQALNKQKRIPYSCIHYARTILSNHSNWNRQYAKNASRYQRYASFNLFS
jgi:soluble lytic murein transglycosylase